MVELTKNTHFNFFCDFDIIHFCSTQGRHQKKNQLTFGHFPKGGGGGSDPNPKVLGQFCWDFFWTFLKEGWRVNPFQKFWGSFYVVLRQFLGGFEIVFCVCFFSSNVCLKESYPKGVQNGCGGWGERPLLENVQKKADFFWMSFLREAIL